LRLDTSLRHEYKMMLLDLVRENSNFRKF
jgi:hypothetical protein